MVIIFETAALLIGAQMREDRQNYVERLDAMEAIRSLALRYARSMDETNEAELRILWTQTREATLPWIDLGVIESVIIPSWGSRGRSQMRVLSHEIEVQQDRARGIVTGDVLLELNNKTVYQSLRYFDHYQCDTTGTWHFERRFHELIYGSLITESPWSQPSANWPQHQHGTGEQKGR